MVILIATVTISVVFPAVEQAAAASFNIDDLNLQEALPSTNPPAAYFKIGLKETWNFLNSLKNLTLATTTIGIVDTGVDAKHPEFDGVNFGNTPPSAKVDAGTLSEGLLFSHGRLWRGTWQH